MTKQVMMSLTAAGLLACMATLSIGGAVGGAIAFNDQPDAMVAQLYVPDTAAIGQSPQMVASVIVPAAK